MKLLYGLRNNILSFGCVSSFVDITDVTKRFGTEILNYNGLEFFKELDALTDEEKAEAVDIAKRFQAQGYRIFATRGILSDRKEGHVLL